MLCLEQGLTLGHAVVGMCSSRCPDVEEVSSAVGVLNCRGLGWTTDQQVPALAQSV